MGQPQDPTIMPIGDPVTEPVDNPDRVEGFCPACGEPQINGKIKHAEDCPYHGDDREPSEGNF